MTLFLLLNLLPAPTALGVSEPGSWFLDLLTVGPQRRGSVLRTIEDGWQPGFEVMVLETLNLSRDYGLHTQLYRLLRRKTGESFGFDRDRWYEWLWRREEQLPPGYPEFKAALYSAVDPRFAAYFGSGRPTKIRLDEVRWGGVEQDGIPPLRQPKMIKAGEAKYLSDSNVVFGVEVEGEARAYPKRILAWHEMFVDEIGGVPVTGAYCTLCGSMILYRSKVGDTVYELGTSGFLYRSNKLMYDRATQSLWNTLWGEPVVGPLVEHDLALERLSVVTTTWGSWRRRHPDTLVLSRDTGHRRDYSEGAAYRDYFATDRLMFNVPKLDKRLKNKAEVLGLVFPEAPGEALALASSYLEKTPIHYDDLGPVSFVVVTDRSGAHRVYEAGGVELVKWRRDEELIDKEDRSWSLTEAALVGADGRRLRRLPAHRAFWFGWFSAYTHTRLIR